jgi:cytochrome c peroxidase
MRSRILAAALAAFAVAGLVACGNGKESPNATTSTGTASATTQKLSLAAQVGQKLFFDKTLSGSGKMACATCHDPAHAYGPPNDLAVQLGGKDMQTAGLRAVPSLRYKDVTPAYADLLDNPDGISAPGPGGGFTWDGRVDTLAEQAKIPLLSSFEMANDSPADVVNKVMAAPYADLVRQAYGSDIFSDSAKAFDSITAALEAYQREDVSFHPYTSKFDLYAGNKIGGTLTPAEIRGMQVYSDPNRGNCASCHYQGAGLNGSVALFTDFSYEAIGVPRNGAIPANADASYQDLGVCGPQRTDHKPASVGAEDRFCGMFKSPTLRNVATRSAFFHNGVIHSLEQAVRFYNTRDTHPEIWYPTVGGTPKAQNDVDFPTYGLIKTQYVGGKVQKYDDLPAAYAGNIDGQIPLDGRAPGAKNPMTEQEVSDLLCFLNTLNDDYTPPATAPASGTCVN